MPETIDVDTTSLHIIARTIWATEWKRQNPDAGQEALEATWSAEKSQHYKMTRKILAKLNSKGYALTKI